jgi:hypothetical protein
VKRITAALMVCGVLIVASIAEPQYGPSAVPEGALVRLQGTNQVYVIQGGRKCYIPDYDTFQSRGYQWQHVVEVDRVTLDRIATGVPVPSVRQKFQYTPPGQSPDGQAGGMPARGPMPTSPMPGAAPDAGAAGGSFPGGIGGNRPTFGKSPLNIPTPAPGMPTQQAPGSMQPGIGAPPPMLPTPMSGTPPQ